MKESKKPIQSREEKIEFLNGLMKGTRSLTEITEPPVIFLSYRDDRPDEVLNELTGKIMTIEQAEAIKNKEYVDTVVWVEKKRYLDNSANETNA